MPSLQAATTTAKFKEEKPRVSGPVSGIGAARRAENPDHWVDLWKKELMDLQKIELEQDTNETEWIETLVIVDDCRYPNELDAAKEFDTDDVYAGSRWNLRADADWRAHESEEMSQKVEAMLPDYQAVRLSYLQRQDLCRAGG